MFLIVPAVWSIGSNGYLEKKWIEYWLRRYGHLMRRGEFEMVTKKLQEYEFGR